MIDPVSEERALRRSRHRALGLAHPQLQRRLHVPCDTGKHALARPLAPDMDNHIVGVAHEPVPAPLKLAVQTGQQNVRQQRIWEPEPLRALIFEGSGKGQVPIKMCFSPVTFDPGQEKQHVFHNLKYRAARSES